LREAICAHVQAVTRGGLQPLANNCGQCSQQALDLIVRVLIEPGARVAIEDPQYQGTRENTADRRGSFALSLAGKPREIPLAV